MYEERQMTRKEIALCMLITPWYWRHAISSWCLAKVFGGPDAISLGFWATCYSFAVMRVTGMYWVKGRLIASGA